MEHKIEPMPEENIDLMLKRLKRQLSELNNKIETSVLQANHCKNEYLELCSLIQKIKEKIDI